MSPAGVAMAGVGVASGAGTTALYTNPAGLAAHKSHNFEFGFGRDNRHRRSSFFVQSVDGQAPGFVQGGSSYAYDSGTLADGRKRSGHDARFGMALSGQSDAANVMLGVASRYVDLDYSATATQKKRTCSGWTGDVGLAIALTGNLRLGVVWRNILELEPEEMPQRIAGGVAIALKGVIVAGDASWGIDKPGHVYRVGAAASVIDELQLRAGYKYSELGRLGEINPVPAHWLSGGFGFRFASYSIDAAVALDLARASEVQVTVALNYYVPKMR